MIDDNYYVFLMFEVGALADTCWPQMSYRVTLRRRRRESASPSGFLMLTVQVGLLLLARVERRVSIRITVV